MSRYHIDFVAFDFPFENHGGATLDDALTKLLDHRLNVAAVHVEFPGDLQSRQVQSHEVEADDPGSQRFVTAGEDRPGEIIEPFLTPMAEVSLAFGLGVIAAIFDDRCGVAMRASHPIGPTHFADGLKAFGVIDEVANVDHLASP